MFTVTPNNYTSLDYQFLCYNVDVNRPDYYKGEIRLSNGTYKSRGLLEIYLNRKWGTVCNEKFTIRIGDVICRQLGYTNAVRFGSYQL